MSSKCRLTLSRITCPRGLGVDMLPLGLSAARQREFHRALWNHHTVTPHAQVLTLDHKVVANVSDMIVDGEVNFANDGETSRSASLSLFDPHGHIGFGANDPSDGARSEEHTSELQSRGQ